MKTSGDAKLLRPASDPFETHGGLGVLKGNLGKAIVKTSALAHDKHAIEGEVLIFHSQEEMQKAFKRGDLHRDVVVVVASRAPAPTACRSCTSCCLRCRRCRTTASRWPSSPTAASPAPPATSSRRSTSRQKQPTRPHRPVARRRPHPPRRLYRRTDGAGPLRHLGRPLIPIQADLTASHFGTGRELFSTFRRTVSPADKGASIFEPLPAHVPEPVHFPILVGQ